MQAVLIEKLEQGFERLINALDGRDADEIIGAAAAIRPLVNEIEAVGSWRETEAMKMRLSGLSQMINASQMRVSKLTELNRHRAENLTLAMQGRQPVTYSRYR